MEGEGGDVNSDDNCPGADLEEYGRPEVPDDGVHALYAEVVAVGSDAHWRQHRRAALDAACEDKTNTRGPSVVLA